MFGCHGNSSNDVINSILSHKIWEAESSDTWSGISRYEVWESDLTQPTSESLSQNIHDTFSNVSCQVDYRTLLFRTLLITGHN